MARLRFRELELEAFVHATESRDAVEAAVLGLAPGARVEREGLTGHFGQALVVVRARLRDPAGVEGVVARVAKSIGPELARTADRRVDGQGRVFARFDKQAAAVGRIELASKRENDVIKFTAKVRPPPRGQAEVLAAFRERFGGAGAGRLEGEEE